MERNVFCGKQNTLKHGHFGTIAAHFINLITIDQIRSGKVLGEVWVVDVTSKKYSSQSK